MNNEVHKDETSGKGINAKIKHNTNVEKSRAMRKRQFT
jgi:hypothetical protein